MTLEGLTIRMNNSSVRSSFDFDFLGILKFASLSHALCLPVASGRKFSRERGWAGLEMELNEDANASLCYT